MLFISIVLCILEEDRIIVVYELEVVIWNLMYRFKFMIILLEKFVWFLWES